MFHTLVKDNRKTKKENLTHRKKWLPNKKDKGKYFFKVFKRPLNVK